MSDFDAGFLMKGFKHGGTYYVHEKENGFFNIYQLTGKTNAHITAPELKKALPFLMGVSDSEVIVNIPGETYPAFLIMYEVDMLAMNAFRIRLDAEEILRYREGGAPV